MIRHVLAVWVMALFVAPAALAADASVEDLFDVLRIDQVIEAMRVDGLTSADDLANSMLPGGTNDSWRLKAQQIYDTAAMETLVMGRAETWLSQDDIDEAMRFFQSPLGQRILSLEISARVALADPAVEEIARRAYDDTSAATDATRAAVDRFVLVNDLVERNVAGALSSTYRFYRGLTEGGAFELTEDEILRDVYSDEPEVRSETLGWLYGFLMMAYQPLEPSDIDAYTAYSTTAEGQALNAALFDGFDAMFDTISYALGLGIADMLSSVEL